MTKQMMTRRYCEMCDKWVPRRETTCRACGGPTTKPAPEPVEAIAPNTLTICESRRVVRPCAITLDHALRLPMAGRLRTRMRTVCDACREPITDEFFYGGFAAGHRNLLLHERCTPEAMRTHPIIPLRAALPDAGGRKETDDAESTR